MALIVVLSVIFIVMFVMGMVFLPELLGISQKSSNSDDSQTDEKKE